MIKVAYITTYDSEDVTKWSGTGYYLAKSLEQNGVEIIRINCGLPFSFYQRLKRKVYKWLFNKQLLIEREAAYLRKVARKAKKELAEKKYDIALAPGSLPVAYLQIDKPLVVFTDATYDCLMKLYLQDTPVASRSMKQGNLAEAAALDNASRFIYTSDWAKESAIRKYNAIENKIKVSYLGANFHQVKSKSDIHKLISRRMEKPVKSFLFIGVEWKRKGALQAIDTIQRLNALGLQASLTLVGCKLPPGLELPSFVQHIPFVSKATKEGTELLNSLFETATYFILPTMADCSPVVFSEAASYALPVLTTNTGGCNTIIKHGHTGYCFPVASFTGQAVQAITDLSSQPDAYRSMSLNAYHMYESELNWDVVGKKTFHTLNEVLAET